MSDAIHCADCGRFIAYADMDEGAARIHYVPDSDCSTEVCEWVCQRCIVKPPETEAA